MKDSERFVTLRTGPTVPVACLRLAWNLEDRGCRFSLSDSGRLLVSPRHLLTDADRDGLRKWRDHLVMLLQHFAIHDADAALLPVLNARPTPERLTA